MSTSQNLTTLYQNKQGQITKTKGDIRATKPLHNRNKLLHRTQTIFIVLSLFWFLPTSVWGQVNYQHFLWVGQNELAKNNFTQAIYDFNTAISSKPNGFEAYFLRGIAKYSLGDFKGAANDFTRVVQIHPLYTRAYQYRGICYDRLNNFTGALRDFAKALELDPFNPDIYVARGNVEMHMNRFTEAIKDYSKAIQLEPKMGEAYLNRGIAYHLSKKDSLAIRDVNKAIKLDYFNVDAWIKRGMIRYEMDSLHKALQDFNHAASIKPDYPYIYFQRALVYLKLGDTARVLHDYGKVLQLDPNNALTYYNRALIRSMQKNYQGALADYSKVISINPRNVYAYYNRGVVELQMHKPKQAEEDYTKALEIFPGFVGAYINRSYARQQLGDKKGALADHDSATRIIAKAHGGGRVSRELYKQYGDSTYFNKIMAFEADFLNGEMRKGRVQFQKINIEPLPDFYLVYAFDVPVSQYDSYEERAYTDKNILLFNNANPLGIRLVFTTKSWPFKKEEALQKEKFIGQNGHLLSEPANVVFLQGIIESMLRHYKTAIIDYDSCLRQDSAILYAYFNRAATRAAWEDAEYAEKMYEGRIGISLSNFNHKQKAATLPHPDYQKSLADYDKVLQLNPKMAFAYYNRANLKLKLKKFQRAIDDYSAAIRLEPKMAEAYYNRALILLYLKENKLACKDLSKAGELGISAAYNVIKRYCTRP